jgi:TrmH family RNA methyltransferase
LSAEITSPGNERIKWLVRLRERRHRDAEGVFLVEGERLYQRAIGAGMVPVATFMSDLASTGTVGPTVTVDRLALDRASYRQQAEGVIAVFPQIETRLEKLDMPANPLILIAEDVEKPGNLGAMLRTAAAAGADGLITVGQGVDPHNPNVVRSSAGALFEVPLAVSSWDELSPWLARHRIRVVCASPRAPDVVWDADLTGAMALVVGAEARGLSATALAVAEQTVSIPQVSTSVDSLNVSVAAAIVLFEAVRQRSEAAD